MGATCAGVRVWSLYVPNGREIQHAHYTYKLAWLQALAMTAHGEKEVNSEVPSAFLGDFNIAPRDEDVWDMSVFDGATHVSPSERDALAQITSIGFHDVIPRSLKGPPYTFWDYRNGALHRGWGMRIDLVLGNDAFRSRVVDAYVDRDARKGKGASDHAPVVVDLDM